MDHIDNIGRNCREFSQNGAQMAYQLPALPYAYEALEPYIDAETMRLHHDQHHRSYIDKLNQALAPYPQFNDMIVEDLLRNLQQVPEEIRTAVRNDGGGHANHQFFWKVIGPASGGKPTGALAEAIAGGFGSLAEFQTSFTDAAARHFGSGWAFLVVDPPSKKLELLTTANQDSVLLQGKPGLLACDVWEHSYYLKYRDRRPEYLQAWWKVVNWPVVSSRYEHFLEGRQQL